MPRPESDWELLEGQGWLPPLSAFRPLSSLSCSLALWGTTFPRLTGSRLWRVSTSGSPDGRLDGGKKGEPGCSPRPPSSAWGYLFGGGCVSSDHHGPALPGRGSDHTTFLLHPLCPAGGPGSLLLWLNSERLSSFSVCVRTSLL